MDRFAHRFCIVALLVLPLLSAVPARAASAFATPAFQQQWQTGEAITPNFWGPLANARDGQQEPYKEAPGGQRLVQYFDKGRMELTNGTVTNGLLANELVTGDEQIGDATYEHHAPPAIAIAGDASNAGPTYPMIFNAASKSGYKATLGLTMLLLATGDLVPFDRIANFPELRQAVGQTDPTLYTAVNVFAAYRERVGLATIGYAITKPFWVNVTVGGTARDVLVQVFERRLLTYTPSNPDAFKVEMGNIGQHYYQWRYGGSAASPAAAPSASPATAPTQAPITGVAPVFAATAATLQARGSPAIGLGAATSDAYTENGIALLQFEHGTMLYLPRLNTFYAIIKPTGSFTVIPRTFGDGGLTTTQMPGPRAGTFVPRLGFGKVWQDNPALQQSLGYATGDEQRYSAQAQTFERGVIVVDSIDSAIYVLNTATGVWDGGPV